jgi:serine O-acetyltransferase
MTWQRCRGLITSDLWRYAGKSGTGTFWEFLFSAPGFRYTVLLRLYAWSCDKRWRSLGARQAVVLLLHHYTIRFGIDISRDARIGSGFYIGHFGGIFVNEGVVIGDNCNIAHGVTLGQLNHGDRAGCPIIGNNVFIAPGAKIIGRMQIGNHALVGANAVVMNDVAPHTSVGGVPARPISHSGSDGYVNRTDYPVVPAR